MKRTRWRAFGSKCAYWI